jgi:hypothetical protein
MRTWTSHLDALTVVAALGAALVVGGCGKETSPPAPKTANVPTDVTAQTATPAPPGDSTPAPAKDDVKVEANESGKSGSQSTVGTAASGAPPETQQSAPEGNPAPKGGAVKK